MGPSTLKGQVDQDLPGRSSPSHFIRHLASCHILSARQRFGLSAGSASSREHQRFRSSFQFPEADGTTATGADDSSNVHRFYPDSDLGRFLHTEIALRDARTSPIVLSAAAQLGRDPGQKPFAGKGTPLPERSHLLRLTKRAAQSSQRSA